MTGFLVVVWWAVLLLAVEAEFKRRKARVELFSNVSCLLVKVGQMQYDKVTAWG